ncbi:hypothetical protein [Arthrobacter sp. H35-D1]|uniref:hypothetical protein n=1 Tax=Arthrobacter sp. H35-D1 TaxID=3046202 RepID=UPI0024B90D60|nr:hypothetical protein [Arthrobacter sp. H35-D1]
MCALRLGVGAAFFIALFMVLSASGALAASDADPVAANPSETTNSKQSANKGLLSGILNPVVGVVDQTVSKIPVVGDITGNNTVAKVAAPVSAVTDRVETSVTSVPVVGEVVAPVGNLSNAVVPPVVNIVDTVTTPVLKTADKVSSPVVQIVDPVVVPVTEALKPIVDGAVGTVSGSVASVVDEVLPPMRPSAPEIPAKPAVPSTPETPGNLGTPPTAEVPEVSGAQSVPDGGNGPSDSPELLGDPGNKESASSDVTLETADAVENAGHGKAKNVGTSGKVRTLADYLAARTFPGLMAHEKTAGGGAAVAITTMATPGGSQAACGADSNMPGVGPCAPAISTSPASSGSFGAGASGAGGSTGSAAAHENYADWFSVLLEGSAVHSADWQLPASTPSVPGSTPG